MIEIDGSINEGGGQILRTALGLSAYTKKPFKIINIRKNRPQPGLKEQHLQAVNATAILCNAEVAGNSLHSTNLTFITKEITKKELNIKVSTAGSIGLVLQALMIPASKLNLKIKIDGGGDFGKWAPPTLHIQQVLIPLLEKMDYFCNLNIRRYGFYPKGGSQIEFFSNKSKLKRLNIASKEKKVLVSLVAAVFLFIFPLNFLSEKLKLTLHPDKVNIRKYRQGADFLGYVVLPHHIAVRTRTKKRMFRKIAERVAAYQSGTISKASMEGALSSYLGVLSHANAHELTERFRNQFWITM